MRLLLAAAFAFLALPINAQTPSPRPSFKSISITPAGPHDPLWNYKPSADGITITGITVKGLIFTAYEVKVQNILGGPDWVNSAAYNITAKFSDADARTLAKLPLKQSQQQVRLMLRSMLEDRFKLHTTRETKELVTYGLVIAPGGVKFSPSPPVTPATQAEPAAAKGPGGWSIYREPISFWATQLASMPEVGHPVADQTGLAGDYKFQFDWPPPQPDPNASIFTALQQQLGLKLEPHKATIEAFTIDHIERPTVN